MRRALGLLVLVFPLFLAAVFALLWLVASRLTRSRAVRIATSTVGTLLVAVVAFLILWAQASGS